MNFIALLSKINSENIFENRNKKKKEKALRSH